MIYLHLSEIIMIFDLNSDFMFNSGNKKTYQQLIDELEALRSENAKLKEQLSIESTDSDFEHIDHRTKKNLFHSIFEEAGIGMAIINKNAELVKFNKIFKNIFGYSRDELYKKNYYDLLPENRKQDASRFVQAMFKSELSKYEGEQIYVNSSGNQIWMKVTATPIYDTEGKPEFLIGMGEDITELKHQEKIRETVYSISNAVNNSDNLFQLIEKIRESLSELIDSKYFFIALYNEQDDSFSVPFIINQQKSFETFQADKSLVGYVKKKGQSISMDYKQILELEKTGEILIAGKLSKQWMGVPLYSKNQFIGVIGVHSFENDNAFNENHLEILELLSSQVSTSVQKMRSEEDLKIERAYFKELFENSPEAIAIVQNTGNIVNVNQAFTQLFGYTKQESLNQFIEKLICNDAIRDEALHLTDEITMGKVVKVETKRQKKDGSLVDVSIWGTPVNIDLGQIAIYVIFRDITERVEAEKKLKLAKEKAEESDRLKTAFLTNMSHEIRTPMNAIIGFSDLIADPNLDSEGRYEFVQQIYNSSNMLLKLLDDIIDISKIDIGDIELQYTKINLNSLFDELKEKVEKEKQQEQKSKIEILVHNPLGDIVSYIHSDEHRFKQIFEHLLSNALKYTESGFIEFGYNMDQFDKPTFYVRDTGIGISEENKDKIFRHFTKIEDRAKLYRGIGIGLTITQKLIHLMGGELEVESHPGIGSIFYFNIPSKIEILDYQKLNGNNNNHFNWNGRNILVAEDEDSNYLVIKASLSRTYANLIRVTNGEEAVEYCKNKDIDLVLMDIKLPLLDGIEATREIKKIKPNLPIIAQTAYIHKNERETCLKAGCVDYIPKPIKSNELLKIIHNCFS